MGGKHRPAPAALMDSLGGVPSPLRDFSPGTIIPEEYQWSENLSSNPEVAVTHTLLALRGTFRL